MTISLSTLRSRAQKRADMENSNFVTDAEWNEYINSAYKELYDILVMKFEDHYVTESATSTVAVGSDSFAVPSDFYKVLGVDVLRAGTAGSVTARWEKLDRFNFNERNRSYDERYRRGLVRPYARYRILQDTVKLVPSDNVDGTYRVWYVPVPTEMTLDADTIDTENGYEEFIILEAAKKAATKEENYELVQALEQQKQFQLQRIEQAAANRDIGEADTITDIHAEDRFWW